MNYKILVLGWVSGVRGARGVSLWAVDRGLLVTLLLLLRASRYLLLLRGFRVSLSPPSLLSTPEKTAAWGSQACRLSLIAISAVLSLLRLRQEDTDNPVHFSDAATAFMAITAPAPSSEFTDTTAGIFMSDGKVLYTARCRL